MIAVNPSKGSSYGNIEAADLVSSDKSASLVIGFARNFSQFNKGARHELDRDRRAAPARMQANQHECPFAEWIEQSWLVASLC
jgi:hypothetical protein